MKKFFVGALSALLALGALVVPAVPGSAETTASSERIQRAAAGVAERHAAASGPSTSGEDGKASSAEVRTRNDSYSDVPYCGGDLVSFRVDYGTSAMALSATVACNVNPSTSQNWIDGMTVVGWVFDHTNNGSADYVAVFINDEGTLTGGVVRSSDNAVTCTTAGTWDGSATYSASFAPSCFGTPTSTYASSEFTWDENPTGDDCSCPTDFAPDDGVVGPIFRGSPPAPNTGASGYWMVGQNGAVYAFGAARNYGSANIAHFPGGRATDIESRANDNAGYWVLDNFGHVFAFGSAPWYGNVDDVGGLRAGEEATTIAGTKSGLGYYVFTNRGRAIKFGDAVHRGDMSSTPLNGPVLDSTLTGAGNGYWMVGSDGGIFSFNASFHGSMGGQPLNQPVNGMAADPDNVGYWLVASDGGVFAFKAPFMGSMGDKPLNRPVIGMVAYGNGYLMVASDGGIFNFSNKAFVGSLGGSPPASPVVSVAPVR